MEMSQILRKLQPLMPEQVERWLRTLDTGQAEVKALVERQIRYTAHKVLGDFRNKMLLSLPPASTAKGSFHLGTVLYEREKWSVGISRNELMQNLAVFGRSGAGKTNVVFHLLQQLAAKRIPFLFLDWKRTARHLIPLLGKKVKIFTPGRSLAPFPFNPLIVPPGLEQTVYLNHVVDVLAQAYTLGDGAKSILHKALASCFTTEKTPSFADVLQAIESMQTKDRATGWKMSAQRAIESVASSTVAVDKNTQQEFARSLLRQNTVIELDGLSQNARKFLIPLLCYWIYSVRLASQDREQLQFVIVFEEAHHTLYRQEHRSKETLMNVLLRQGRELGIGSIVVDQHPHLISSAALGNCYTTICLNQKDPTDINKAAGLSLVEDSEKTFFSMLPVGQGIVKMQDRWRKPFLVKFPLVPIRKGLVTDVVLDQLVNGKLTLSELRERAAADEFYTGPSRERCSANSLVNYCSRLVDNMEEGTGLLLDDVVRFPDDGVDARYKRLGVSADKGNRWKQQLVGNGLLRSERVKVGQTHRVRLLVTDEAHELLVNGNGRDPQASFVHEYWKRVIARRFEQQGYQVTLEAPRRQSQGCMDIMATRASGSIAIEIETGKSNVVSNVKRDLLEGVQKVFVVATDEGALKKVERQLAKEELLISPRVVVVLRDQLDDVVVDG